MINPIDVVAPINHNRKIDEKDGGWQNPSNHHALWLIKPAKTVQD